MTTPTMPDRSLATLLAQLGDDDLAGVQPAVHDARRSLCVDPDAALAGWWQAVDATLIVERARRAGDEITFVDATGRDVPVDRVDLDELLAASARTLSSDDLHTLALAMRVAHEATTGTLSIVLARLSATLALVLEDRARAA